MKIIINGNEFENVKWNVENGIGKMIFQTKDSVSEIFAKIGVNADVYVYNDEGVLTSKWFNKDINGIGKQDEFTIVELNVSLLDANTEELLQSGIDESVDAIIELADMISGAEESIVKNTEDITKAKSDIEQANTDIDKTNKEVVKLNNEVVSIKTTADLIPDIRKSIDGVQTQVNEVQSRITGIPEDIIERFSLLWANYNALADRVARLENK